MSRRMRDFLRQAFGHLLIPASVGVLWAYAHVRNLSVNPMIATWREGKVVRTGNPYTSPNPVPRWLETDSDDDDRDEAPPQAVAGVSGPDLADP